MIAALTVTGTATAAEVQLSTGHSCTYSTMTVTPNGNVVVNCGTSAASFSVTAPSSLPQNFTTTTEVKIARTGSTTDAVDVGYSITGPCTAPSGGSLNIPSGAASSNLVIETGAASSTRCIISVTAPPAGGTIGAGANIEIVNPDANVTFSFATSSSTVAVGGGAIAIRVNRGGGTNGTFTVPLELSGSLAPGGTPLTGNLSATSLTFTPSDSFKNVTYTPPSVTPATPGLPAQLVLTFGNVSGGTPPQEGSGSGTHTLTLDGPSAGCPAPTPLNSLGAGGSPFLLAMPSGDIKTYSLPTPTNNKSSGIFKLSSTSSSNPVAPWYYEVHINKCRGLIQEPAPGVKDTCYGKFANANAVFSKYWFNKPAGAYSTQARIENAGYCYAPATEGPWYVNIRYTYAGCTTGICGWSAQWTNFTY
jgi:hypothetical protein